MESYKIQNLTFKYPFAQRMALDCVNLEIKKGEFIVVCGKSGCGKTTLLKMLKPMLSPNGESAGRILFEGRDIHTLDNREMCEKIGFVMQSPDNQIVTDKVWHELAFGPESLGMKSDEIRMKAAEMASFFGIEGWFHKKVTDLSGGQKQLLNLASVMVMEPSVLLLDEPTSQLDPIAAQEFLSIVAKINRELGVTVILSEHRLEEALALSDRVVVMDEGKITQCSTPEKIGNLLRKERHPMFYAMPTPMRTFAEVENGEISPVTVREGREWLSGYFHNRDSHLTETDTAAPIGGECVLSLENVSFRYYKNGPDVVKGLSAKFCRGGFYAILGGNGSGKTTMLSLISGINKPLRGKVEIPYKHTKIGALPQNPQTLFIEKTVEKDMWEVLSDEKTGEDEKKRRITECMQLCELEALGQRHPYDLSGGEMQRAALCKVLLQRPDILLLDEPTKGLDAHFKKKLANIIMSLKNAGVTIIMVSHDVEFCCEYTDSCAMLFDGAIISENAPRSFFSGKSFYTTQASRMSRGIIENAVLPDDIVRACGLNPEEDIYTTYTHFDKSEANEDKLGSFDNKTPKGKRKIKISTLLSFLVLLIAIPLTIFVGKEYLDNRRYYFISLMIILEIMVPFAFSYEKRKPSARELVVLGVLCALAVLGRMAFFMLHQFKPTAALVIISGVCFGPEAGFLIGAMSAFVSNFFFSQGPWTPWQMSGFALLGFLAGLLYNGLLKKNRISLSAFGFFATTFIYGVLLNIGSVLMYTEPTKELVLTALSMGFPLDVIHGGATAFFLYLLAPGMIEKLEKIKHKYAIGDK